MRLEQQTACPAQLLIAQWAIESKWGEKPVGPANYKMAGGSTPLLDGPFQCKIKSSGAELLGTMMRNPYGVKYEDLRFEYRRALRYCDSNVVHRRRRTRRLRASRCAYGSGTCCLHALAAFSQVRPR